MMDLLKSSPKWKDHSVDTMLLHFGFLFASSKAHKREFKIVKYSDQEPELPSRIFQCSND